MTRRHIDEDRRPRHFDPKQRGHDFARTRSRRKRGQNEKTPEKRIDQLETWSYLNSSVATQAAATTLIEVVNELPDATYLDIGRQIILRSPTAVHDILYVGMQLQDDTVAWIQWTSTYEDSPNTAGYAWVEDKTFGGSGFASGIRYISQFAGGGVTGFTGTYPYYNWLWTPPSNGLSASARTSFPPANRYGIYYNGTLTYLARGAGGGIEIWNGTTKTLDSPNANAYWALAYDAFTNTLMATNTTGNQCHKLNISTLAIVSSFYLDCSNPQGIVTDSAGNVYVADTGNNRIRKSNSSLVHQVNWGTSGNGSGEFSAPKGLAVDASNNIYVADSGNNRIQVFSSTGVFLAKFGIGGSSGGQLSNPTSVAINGSNIYVADTGNNRVSVWLKS